MITRSYVARIAVAVTLLAVPGSFAAPGSFTGTVTFAAPVALAAQSRPLSLDDYYRLADAGSPAISPDGSRVAYVVTSIVEEENRRHSEIWLAAADGAFEPMRLTSPSFDASAPRWSADGSLLAFSSRRPGGNGADRSGGTWFLHMDRPAGEAFQIEGLAGAPVFSPDGRWMAFTSPTPPQDVEPAGSEPEVGPEPTDVSELERKTVERFDGRVYDWMNYRFDRDRKSVV